MIVDSDGQGCSVANFNIGGGTFTRAYDLTVNIFLTILIIDANIPTVAGGGFFN